MQTPSTYYPSWQTDAATHHHQGWTNQFMQHIPHTSSAAAAGPMDFGTPQTYPYAATAAPNGSSVQNGIIFDPNYSRSYATAAAAAAAPGTDNYATNALTGLANVSFDEASRNGDSYGVAAGGSSAATSKSVDPQQNAEGSATNHHLSADANNSRTLSPNNNNHNNSNNNSASNQPSNYEPNSAPPPSTVAHNGGSEWDWGAAATGNEKMYQQAKPKDHSMASDYNSGYYNHNAGDQQQQQPHQHQHQHSGSFKKDSHSPTKSDSLKAQNQFEPYHSQSEDNLKLEEKSSHKDSSSSSASSFAGGKSSHERNFLANDSQKYPPFNHQSYFNMYYPSTTTYGMEHASSKYHSVLPPPHPPPPSSSAYHHHHQAHYPDHHQQQQYSRGEGGKDKKVYQHDDRGGTGATSANSLLVAGNESGGDESSSSKNNTTYDKSRKESKLYQPQLNLHNGPPTRDGNNLTGANGESVVAGKGESYKHHQSQHQQQQQQQSNRLLMSPPSSMAIKEEPIDGYYHHNQNSAATADPRDYQQQQSKLYQPQNGYYPMYDLNGGGVEDTTSHPVSCPTNFEKEIPAHTYHIPGRLNGNLEDMSNYGKLPNGGIKSEPVSQDYNSDGGLTSEQFYGGVVEDKVGQGDLSNFNKNYYFITLSSFN